MRSYPQFLAALALAVVTAACSDRSSAPVAPTDPEIAAPGATFDKDGKKNEFVVDDDKQQCKDADFMSIQAAVTAAPAGATIKVCPGTYNENVTVNKPLTFQGSTDASKAGDPKKDDSTDPTKSSIVNYPSAPVIGTNYGFGVFAPNVTINGFTIQSAVSTDDGIGIYMGGDDAGFVIERNVIQKNTVGVYPSTAGGRPSAIRNNLIRDNNNPGGVSGTGVYSDFQVQNLVVEGNEFRGHVTAAVNFDGVTSTIRDITVRNNTMTHDNSVALFNTRSVLVENNKMTDGQGTLIYLGGGNTDIVARNNDVNGTTGNGASINHDFYPAPNQNILLENNHVRGAMQNGIRIVSSGFVLAKNNQLTENAGDGLHVESPSSGNRLENNQASKNGMFDCYDDTVGPGTAGTANFWINDHGKTQNRVGLCKP